MSDKQILKMSDVIDLPIKSVELSRTNRVSGGSICYIDFVDRKGLALIEDKEVEYITHAVNNYDTQQELIMELMEALENMSALGEDSHYWSGYNFENRDRAQELLDRLKGV